jgi:protein-tyrosine phosphatase
LIYEAVIDFSELALCKTRIFTFTRTKKGFSQMIDLHCHLLPAVDDGSRSMEQSLALAKQAVNDGITHSVLTPHIHAGRYSNMRSNLEPVFADFKAELAKADIKLKLSLGGEVRLGIEIIQLLEANEIPMLGEMDGYKIMLLEFPHSHILPGADKLVSLLMQRNIRPLIAHPERNKDVMRSLDKIYPFVQAGCLLQVTAGSLCGKFGKYAEKRAKQLLEKGWVTVLASDAHNEKHRPPVISEGRNVAEKIVGKQEADAMVYSMPQRILGGSATAANL